MTSATPSESTSMIWTCVIRGSLSAASGGTDFVKASLLAGKEIPSRGTNAVWVGARIHNKPQTAIPRPAATTPNVLVLIGSASAFNRTPAFKSTREEVSYPKDRSANGTSANDGRGLSGWMRLSLGNAEELPLHVQGIHAQGRIFAVGADRVPVRSFLPCVGRIRHRSEDVAAASVSASASARRSPTVARAPAG